jgi:hypothetical protein
MDTVDFHDAIEEPQLASGGAGATSIKPTKAPI